ncbi:MAG: hypothetical protein WBC08_08965 [Rhodoferax sp.]
MQNQDNPDALAWHKRFAVQTNNRAWDLTTVVRTPEQDREMLDAAHASAWHWAVIGTELNRMRATMLLAEVHALLGQGASSFQFAQEMHAYFLANDTPDWEVAFAHAIYAHAACIAGASAIHRRAYESAKVAIQAIASEEDRAIVMKTFVQIPQP